MFVQFNTWSQLMYVFSARIAAGFVRVWLQCDLISVSFIIVVPHTVLLQLLIKIMNVKK
jgi:hypothetical protein